MAQPASRPTVELARVLGLRQAVALGVGGTVGGGIFVLVGAAAGRAGPAMLAAFGLAFLASLLIALPYAELSCRYPLSGGGYAFARAVLGERTGFATGWGYWGAYVFISGYVTIGFGGYLAALTGLDSVVGTLGLIVGCTALNLLGVRISGAAQVAIVVIAVLALACFGAWGLAVVDPARFVPFAPRGVHGVLVAVPLAFLAFGGFDMVAAAGEEIKDPARNLPRAILLTLGIVSGLYLLVCVAAVGVLGWRQLGASPAPLADAAQGFGGASARTFVLMVALLTTAATANAVLVVTSRVAFAMARDGLLPTALGRTARRSRAPSFSILVNGCLLAVVALSGSVTFVAAAGSFLYVCHFVVPLVALVVLRRRPSERPPAFQTPAPRMLLPLAFGSCAVLLIMVGPTGVAVGLGWLTLGAVCHALAAPRRAIVRLATAPIPLQDGEKATHG